MDILNFYAKDIIVFLIVFCTKMTMVSTAIWNYICWNLQHLLRLYFDFFLSILCSKLITLSDYIIKFPTLCSLNNSFSYFVGVIVFNFVIPQSLSGKEIKSR